MMIEGRSRSASAPRSSGSSLEMPKKTKSSVFDTVEYSKWFMECFRGERVSPLLTLMVPFLDPIVGAVCLPRRPYEGS